MERGEFESIVREHARLVAGAIRRVCGRRHQSLAADIEQDVYLALWKRLGSGKKINYPASYIYKVALTTALAAIQKARPAVPLEEAESASEMNPRELMPQERARALEEALAKLGPDETRAVRAHLAGFNHREVAELFGWTESTARHRIYRSIQTLSEKLKVDDETRD